MSVDVNWFFDILTSFYITRSTATIYIPSHLQQEIFEEESKQPSQQWLSPVQENQIFRHSLHSFRHFSQCMLSVP